MRHAWTRLFRGLETFLMKRKNFFDNSFLVQILIKCGTWWPISKIGNPERTAAIYGFLVDSAKISFTIENVYGGEDGVSNCLKE